MENIRIIHQFEKGNKKYIIAESTKNIVNILAVGQFQIRYIQSILEKYLTAH